MTPIDLTGLSARLRNCLHDEGITTLEQLATIPDIEFMRMPNVGRKTLQELRRLAPFSPPLRVIVTELVRKWGRAAVAEALSKVREDAQ